MRRKGAYIIELAITLLLVAMIFPAVIQLARSWQERNTIDRIRAHFNLLPDAVTKIYRAYESYVFPLAGLAGSGSAYLSYATPFPVALGNGVIAVALYSQTPAAVVDSVKRETSAALEEFGCSFYQQTTQGSQILLEYYCSDPKVTAITYTFSDGSTGSTLSDLSFANLSDTVFPVSAEVTYEWRKGDGSYGTNSHTVNFSLYSLLQQENARKIQLLSNALRTYFLTRLTTEMELRPYPNGLHSVSDHYVPWFWQVLADSGYAYSYCLDSTCSNFTTTVWKTTTTFAQTASSISNNILGGDTGLLVDSFGRPFRIILVGNGCTGDLSTCAADNNAPPKPTDGYYNLYGVKPPFFTWIVSDDSNCLKDPASPNWCRYQLFYEN